MQQKQNDQRVILSHTDIKILNLLNYFLTQRSRRSLLSHKILPPISSYQEHYWPSISAKCSTIMSRFSFKYLILPERVNKSFTDNNQNYNSFKWSLSGWLVNRNIKALQLSNQATKLAQATKLHYKCHLTNNDYTYHQRYVLNSEIWGGKKVPSNFEYSLLLWYLNLNLSLFNLLNIYNILSTWGFLNFFNSAVIASNMTYPQFLSFFPLEIQINYFFICAIFCMRSLSTD